MSRTVLVSLLAIALPLAAVAQDQELAFEASMDASIYETPPFCEERLQSCENANGQSALLAGHTSVPERDAEGFPPLERRALLAFDVSGVAPGSEVTSVELVLESFFQNDIAPAADFSLHRVLESWTEGPAEPGNPPGSGQGAPPSSGDVTWSHRTFDTSSWTNPGGTFAASPSATTTLSTLGTYTWGPTDQMVEDVQAWVDDPSSNHGWILLVTDTGDRGIPTARTARFFGHSEADPGPARGAAAATPTLLVTTRSTPAVVEVPTLGATGAGLLALALGALGLVVLRRRRPSRAA